MERRFKDFNRRMIRCIAVDYATSSLEYSRSYFCHRENISDYTFYRILHTAIERQIVDDVIAEKIAKKSEKNSSKSVGCEGARVRSVQAYARSFDKRKSYVMSDAEVKEIAEAYANSLAGQAEFKELWGLNTKLFNFALTRAIVEGFIDDATVAILRKKAEAVHGEKATILFNDLEAKRNERVQSSKRKKRRSNSRSKRKEHLKFMNETSESFCSPDEIDEYKESMK